MRRDVRFVLLACAAVAVGAWLRHEAITAGFWADDYLQYAMLHGAYPNQRSIWDLFRFADGSMPDVRSLVDYGYLPWWSHPQFRLSMLRPLPSLSHAMDYWLFGTDAVYHHLHTFVWWLLATVAVVGALRALLPTSIALCATALFVLDESQSVPLVWISNRSILMATAFGFAGFWAHAIQRRHPHAALRVASIIAFAAALACGEYALSLLGYFIAFELLASDALAQRAKAVGPFVMLGVVFVAVSALGGYGTAHSGLYTNPLTDPGAYLGKLARGIPVFGADLMLSIPADWASFGSPWQLPNFPTLQLAAGVLAIALAVGLLWLMRSVLDKIELRNVSALALGALLSLLPVLGSFLTTRLLVPACAGVSALFGAFVVAAARRLRAGVRASSLGYATVAALIIAVHAVRAPYLALQSVRFYRFVAQSRTAWPLAFTLDPQRAAQQRVVLIAAADANDAPFFPFVRFMHGQPLPAGFRVLSAAPAAHRVVRVSERALELHVEAVSALKNTVAGSLTRRADERITKGAHFHTKGMDVDVLAVVDGQPSVTRFTFDVPLEDPSLVFIESTLHGLRRFALPKIGGSALVAPPALPNLLLLTPSSS